MRFPCRVLRAGEVTPGKYVLCPLNDERLLRASGKEVWAEMHEHPAPGLRSDASHRYLFGVVYRTICDETGNDPETVHRALKHMAVDAGILEPIYDLIGTELVPSGDPTTKVDQDTHLRYIAWIRHEAEHGRFGARFHIPEPNE